MSEHPTIMSIGDAEPIKDASARIALAWLPTLHKAGLCELQVVALNYSQVAGVL